MAALALGRHDATEPPEPLAVGAAAPRFTLRDTTGDRVAFAPPVARPLVLAFVGTGCSHCVRTAPELVALARRGTTVLAIDAGAGSADERKTFARDELAGASVPRRPGRSRVAALPRVGHADRLRPPRRRAHRRGLGRGGFAQPLRVGAHGCSRLTSTTLPVRAFTTTVVTRGGFLPGSETAQ